MPEMQTAAAATRCKWIARDDEGRPKCEHGWAKKTGDKWRCPEKRHASIAKYNQTEKRKVSIMKYNRSEHGREAKLRNGASPNGRSTKALTQMAQVRTRF